jgi:hypothetical protein
MRSKWFAGVSLFLAVFAASMLRAAENPPPANEPPPTLKEEDNPATSASELELNKDFRIEVKGLSAYAQKQSPALDLHKVVLYLDGTMMGIHAEPVALNGDTLSFRLERTHSADHPRDEESRRAWARVLGSPRGLTRDVTVRVGFEGQAPLEGEIKRKLRIVEADLLFWISLGGFALALSLFGWLATVTNILRESGPEPGGRKRKAFSLGRSQMAFWFLLVLASYLGILLITREQCPIPSQVIGLMGIAAITALGSAAVDISRRSAAQVELPRCVAQKTEAEAARAAAVAAGGAAPAGAAAGVAPATAAGALEKALDREIRESEARLAPSVAQDFWRDILSDADGISLHRFQIVVWTIVLGVIFIVSVYQYLAMPEFDSSLLLLMGISAGAFLGFKIPEKAAETRPVGA